MVNRAAAALGRAPGAADEVVKALWLAVFNDAKAKLRELRLRKALCVEIRRVVGRRCRST